ncbi:hypothetical protein [Ruminococcus flavefaciens]|uniref:hypothetical protein n=1 Tax=Ruminococcus flavefaciens TaxID=1265 RepID=UPI0026F03E92|nr:hypothetical protein [Ruminococcus flavefaciens]
MPKYNVLSCLAVSKIRSLFSAAYFFKKLSFSESIFSIEDLLLPFKKFSSSKREDILDVSPALPSAIRLSNRLIAFGSSGVVTPFIKYLTEPSGLTLLPRVKFILLHDSA